MNWGCYVQSMGQYSDIDKLDLALRSLAQSRSRDQYEERLAALARLAVEHSHEIIALYHAGAFDPMPLVWCLQGQSSHAVMDLFYEALKHRNPYVRWAAAAGIDKSGRSDQAAVFVEALKDRSHLVKGVALGYLKQHGDVSALPGLTHLAGLKSLRSTSPGTVKTAEEAIKAIRNRST
jgi:HEAT repeat protein